MKNPNHSMLLHIGIGDAYCVATEYCDEHPAWPELLRLDRYQPHPKYHRTLHPGCYTDDTQMSAAVARALIDHSPAVLPNLWASTLIEDRWAWAHYFLGQFKCDPRDGYSRNFQSFLETTRDPGEFLKNIEDDSDKNGAAMRSVPLGVIGDVGTMLRVAQTQASITHNTPGGIASSQAVALMSHYTLHVGTEMNRLTEWVCDYLPEEADRLRRPWESPVVGPDVGMKTAHAVLSILRTTRTLREVVLRTLLYRGDTDSVGAIALGIASATHHNDLPDFMEHSLEPGGEYGPGYLRELGRRLMVAHA